MLSSINSNGLLKPFLTEKCKAGPSDYPLCHQIDKIPLDFLWDDGSPLYSAPGLDSNLVAYNRVVGDFCRTPRYLLPFCAASLKNTLRLLCTMDLGDTRTGSSFRNSYAARMVREWFGGEYPQMAESLQSNDRLGIKADALINVIVLIAAVATLLYGSFNPQSMMTTKQFWNVMKISLFAICVNACVSATFSGVYGRLNARIIWMIPFFAAVMIINRFITKRRVKSESIDSQATQA